MASKGTKDSNFLKLKLIENKIIYGVYKPKTIIDVDDAKKMVEERKSLCGDNPYCVLIDLTNLKSVTREARAFFSSNESTENIIAGALVSPSIYHKVMYSIFVSFNKPKIPTRLFSDQESALTWLKKFT